MRILAFAAGAGLLAGGAHLAIAHSGGYGDALAVVPAGALAGGLAVGALLIADAWHRGMRAFAVMLALALLVGEGVAMLRTAKRVAVAQATEALPAREHAATRARLEAVIAAPMPATSPRIDAALSAQAAQAARAASIAAGRYCRRECRALLVEQSTASRAEVAAARKALDARRREQAARVFEARDALRAIGNGMPLHPLATLSGVDGRLLDIVEALGMAWAINAVGALFVFFAAHAKPSHAAPSQAKPSHVMPRHPNVEANAFAVATFIGDPSGRVPAESVPHAYRRWCEGEGVAPLPDAVIHAAIADLFRGVALTSDAGDIVGINWRVPDTVRAQQTRGVRIN